MKRIIASILLLLLPGTVFAAGAGVPLMSANNDVNDKASLQRGAQLFVNYCLSCHSAKFMRYNRMGEDLRISDEAIIDNLLFTGDKTGETMMVALTKEQGDKWFGKAPPDLSVVARSKGPDWIYTFLLSFYEDDDPTRLFGVNNTVLEGAAMPAVLAELQGIQVLVEPPDDEVHHGDNQLPEFKLVQQGSMNPAEFRRAVRDLVNFLDYMGEPAQLIRGKVGMWVLLFLALFTWLARSLYKEYWKDIH